MVDFHRPSHILPSTRWPAKLSYFIAMFMQTSSPLQGCMHGGNYAKLSPVYKTDVIFYCKNWFPMEGRPKSSPPLPPFHSLYMTLVIHIPAIATIAVKCSYNASYSYTLLWCKLQCVEHFKLVFLEIDIKCDNNDY